MALLFEFGSTIILWIVLIVASSWFTFYLIVTLLVEFCVGPGMKLKSPTCSYALEIQQCFSYFINQVCIRNINAGW
jgi:hypothetical protein